MLEYFVWKVTVAAVGGLIMGCLMNGSGKTLDDPRRDR